MDIQKEYKNMCRLTRVNIVHDLCKAFKAYHLMIVYSTSAKYKVSYEEAENMADLFSMICNTECKAEELIHTEDESSDKALEMYDILNDVIQAGYVDKEATFAFCKAMEHAQYGWCWLNSDGYMYMDGYLYHLIGYLLGIENEKDLEYMCVYFKLWEGGKPSPPNKMLIRKAFAKVEETYYDILTKQFKRCINGSK